MSNLKANILFNYIHTITALLFPMLTFPYASRILLPEGIGVVNFQLSIINYIVLFTSLGIPLYAVKEIAKCRDDIEHRNKTTIEIIALSLILCILGYIVVYFIGVFVPQINKNLSLFYILSLTIFFNGIGVQWFYQGVEDFKFTTIRSVLVRIFTTACLFIFVKNANDLLIYAAITVGITVGNNLVNFIYLTKYIPVNSLFKYKLDIGRHVKPALHIFVLNLIISIYINLNTVMLGFIANDYSVGLYTAGNKIPHMILSLVTSMGVVLLPRCSNLVATKQFEDFSKVCDKAIRLVILISIPAVIGLFYLAEPIIMIFCGNEYIEAVPILLWTSPIVLFIGLTNVIGIQILYPIGKENIVIYSTIIGALVNLILNILLIPNLGAIGAGISTFAAELAVLLIQFFIGMKHIPFKLFNDKYLIYLEACLLLIGSVILLSICKFDAYMSVILFLLSCLIYFTFLYMRKDDIVLSIIKTALKRK